MSRALIYRGRGKADLYHVAYNADANGNATRVLLSPRDKWVGNDYWTYDGEITMSTLDRAVRVMARYENRGQIRQVEIENRRPTQTRPGRRKLRAIAEVSHE